MTIKKLVYTITLIAFINLNILAADQNITKVFNDNNLKITIEFNSKSFDNQTSIIEAIKKLSYSIPPQEAAKKYFENLKSTFERAKKNAYFNKSSVKKNADELIDEATLFILDINAREKTIEQSIYLSIFPKELIAALTNMYLIDLTKYIENIDDYEEKMLDNAEEKSIDEKEKINLEMQNTVKDMIKNFFDSHLENIRNILNEYFKF